MDTPWKISFPLLRDPLSQQDCIVIWAKPIKDARPGIPSTMCHALGLARDGRIIKFAAKIRDLEIAKMAPISFVQEKGGIWSPTVNLTGDMTDGK